MPNKTAIALISLTFITIALIFTHADTSLIYTCLAIIATLGGVSIIKNGINPPWK